MTNFLITISAFLVGVIVALMGIVILRGVV